VLEDENFRAVKGLRWLPGAGVNCLIGPGDSGKSTILDAIDYWPWRAPVRCIYRCRLPVSSMSIIQYASAVMLGALDDPLKNIDAYGDFLVGFNAATGGVVGTGGLAPD